MWNASASPYTQKVVSWEAHSEQDKYGDVTYAPPIQVFARKQDHVELVRTSEGKELMSRHIFYVAPPDGLQIRDGDKLDGELVVSSYTMNTLSNKPKMLRFITV